MLPTFLRPERVPYASITLVPAGHTICAWCPDWNPADPANVGASHGMCTPCRQRFEASLAPTPEKLRLTAPELTVVVQLLGLGKSLVDALESIRVQRAFIAAFRLEGL